MTFHVAKAAAVALVILFAASADALPITYNFEAPQFINREVTPLTNRMPNIGPTTFLTTFTSTPTANGLSITNAFPPNNLLTGQYLIDPLTVQTLLLSFNTPVFYLQVDFSLSSAGGQLRLTTPVGTATTPGGPVGGSFQGGTLVFNSPVPFTTAQLAGFNAAGAQTLISIDDLVLDTAPVPEPATCVLVLTGMALGLRKRRSPPS